MKNFFKKNPNSDWKSSNRTDSSIGNILFKKIFSVTVKVCIDNPILFPDCSSEERMTIQRTKGISWRHIFREFAKPNFIEDLYVYLGYLCDNFAAAEQRNTTPSVIIHGSIHARMQTGQTVVYLHDLTAYGAITLCNLQDISPAGGNVWPILSPGTIVLSIDDGTCTNTHT